MGFGHIIVFIYSILSLVASIIGFNLLPDAKKKEYSWKKYTVMATMVMSLLMILMSGWGAFASGGGQ